MSSHNLINKEILAEICPQLRQFRLERQLSLEELKAILHISTQSLKRIENNKYLTFSHFRRLLNFYGKKIKIVIEDE